MTDNRFELFKLFHKPGRRLEQVFKAVNEMEALLKSDAQFEILKEVFQPSFTPAELMEVVKNVELFLSGQEKEKKPAGKQDKGKQPEKVNILS